MKKAQPRDNVLYYADNLDVHVATLGMRVDLVYLPSAQTNMTYKKVRLAKTRAEQPELPFARGGGRRR